MVQKQHEKYMNKNKGTCVELNEQCKITLYTSLFSRQSSSIMIGDRCWSQLRLHSCTFLYLFSKKNKKTRDIIMRLYIEKPKEIITNFFFFKKQLKNRECIFFVICCFWFFSYVNVCNFLVDSFFNTIYFHMKKKWWIGYSYFLITLIS